LNVDDQHSEPTTEAVARAAQTLAVTVSLVEALARLRTQRAHDRADAAEQAAATVRATEALHHDAARLTWTPALDDYTLRRLSATELLQAWAAAQPYRNAEPTATQAADRIENRLREVHPEAMAVYDDALWRGQPADRAMAAATDHLRGEFGFDPAGTPLRFAAAADAEARAAAAGRADDPRSTRVDEGTQSRQLAAGHHASADSLHARALADLACPTPIEQAMRTAPKAAEAMLALPPAPPVKAITAVPHSRKPVATR
jgi:hypothetical protein